MMDDEELRLLRTYRDGKPRIWDAAAVSKIVGRLDTMRLIAPVPHSPGAYSITAEGVTALQAAEHQPNA